MQTFIQLFMHHTSNVPLPQNPDDFCRECAGPLRRASATLPEQKYKDTWVDEGIILFKNSDYICPACSAANGNPIRSTIIPAKGKVLWASQNDFFPKCVGVDWKDKNISRQQLYQTEQSLEDFLCNVPDPPFGLVIGSGGGNNKHFMRYVPMCYSTETITAILMGGFEYVTFRVGKLIEALDFYDSQECTTPREKKELIQNVIKNYELWTAEERLLKIMIYSR
jgi:hypothetical protein